MYIYDTTKMFTVNSYASFYLFLHVRLLWHLLLHILPALKHLHMLVFDIVFYHLHNHIEKNLDCLVLLLSQLGGVSL